MELKVIIEIPKHSNLKYEYDRQTKKIVIDRKLDENDVYPQAYGFIPEALDWDGDELDVLVFSTRNFKPGDQANVKIIGGMEMIDDGETDSKLLCVECNDSKYGQINDLGELNKEELNTIQHFFQTYKRFKNKTVIVRSFKDINWSVDEYHECVKLMKKYGKLPKDEFVSLMRKQHPEKYLNQ